MFKKGMLVFVAIFFFVPIALAANFDADVKIVNNKILLKGTATYEVTINNNGNGTEKYEVYSLSFPTWEAKTADGIKIFKIAPGGSKTAKILVTPLHIDKIGGYVVPLKIMQESTKEVVDVPLRVEIRSQQQLEGRYIPTVLMTYRIEEKIDPNNEIPIEIMLDNQNILDLPELKIKIESNTINDEFTVSLGPKAINTTNRIYNLDPLTAPQEDNIAVSVFLGDEVISGPKFKKFEIIGRVEVVEEEKVERSFLQIRKEVVFYNRGNKAFEDVVRVESKLLRAFFTSTNPKGTLITEGDKKLYSWQTTIEPAGSFSVVLIENYRPLFVILVVVLIIAILYFVFRSPLVVRKSVSNIEKKEGGISEMKVVINVKNRGKRALENITIVDRVPNIVSIEKELSIGTLQPQRIIPRPHKGALIKWVVEKLSDSEERVISYKIKSKLSILGDLNLEPAVAKAHHGKKHIIVKSNIVSISS
jgi:hypothetical protein